MSRIAPNDGLTKFQRYRTAKRQRGMKLLRIWVPDPRAPGFQEEARRQAAVLRGSPDDIAALDFIEATADLEGWR